MQIINLYKYDRGNGKTTVSPIKPEGKEYIEKYRLVADEGKVLTFNGEIVGEVVDTDTTEGWSDVMKEESKEPELKNNRNIVTI